jgi:pyruvate kinase
METPFNRTKIVTTLGPASASPEVLTEMIRAGVDVCRLNASHGSHEDHQKLIDTIRAINEKENVQVSILLDLQGPKIRVGKLAEPYKVVEGQRFFFSTSATQQEGDTLPIDYETFAKDVKPGELVLVEDGKVQLRVVQTNQIDRAEMQVVIGNQIGSRKGVNVPDTKVSLPSLTEKDLEDLELGVKNHVDWIALSFVRRAEDITLLKELLRVKGCNAKVIAKIEMPEALENIDSIIHATDAIMVARGDLGVEIAQEDVPFWQKRIVRKCNMIGRPVIVATQMLESMIENPRPTRAETTDVANAVLDGADAVMVSGETSVGKYPVEVVKVMQRILSKAELEDIVYKPGTRPEQDSKTFLSDAICYSACKFSNGIKAKALVSMTRSGYTAFQLSRHRPRAPIFIFTDNKPLINTLNLVWGVRAYFYDRFVGTNETIEDVIKILKEKGLINTGEIVVNVASMPLAKKARANMFKFTVVE